MRPGNGIEVGVGVFRIEIAVGHPRGVVGRQVQRDALAPEGLADLLHQAGQVGGLAVDMADHDEPGQLHFPGRVHRPAGHQFDAGGGVDDHHGGLHGRQHAQRPPGEIRRTRRVDQVDVGAVVLEMAKRDIGGILQALLFGAVVAHRGAAFDAAGRLDRAGSRQQLLGQHGLAGAGMAEENDVADGSGGWMGHAWQSSALLEGAAYVAWLSGCASPESSGSPGASMIAGPGSSSGSGSGGFSRISFRLARPCSYAEPTIPSIISAT